MQKIIYILKIAIILLVILSGCSPKAFKGQISGEDSNVILCNGKQYLVKGNAPKLPTGAKCTIKPTRNRKKANVTIINH